MKTADVPLGARIPKTLKKKLDRFCDEHGLKMSHLVAAALEDKLGEIDEELIDRELIQDRLMDPEFASQGDYDRYIRRRLSGE